MLWPKFSVLYMAFSLFILALVKMCLHNSTVVLALWGALLVTVSKLQT